ncbi:hypothetical protein BMS3Abin10_00895 [bacterium BMS3Abin10]|nr:hypothetical protein BMS3Abin10_00895 [bacterium BMS3Abin10]GBE37651.1 hypothetical protein BMS3Bbin08_00242 [bacterium BMS3Bbin08]HDH51310.1 DUF86 domain-containing protein [Nitrospirota bacterium]
MIDKELIKNKMADVQGYFKELQPILKEESRDIIGNNLKLHTVERLFQLIVDSAIDINTHIIVESGFNIPNDYQSTFIVLGENKVLPMDFAGKIAPSVGLRNLIIHRYGRVDFKRMIDDIKNEIRDYLEYLKFIDNFLKE